MSTTTIPAISLRSGPAQAGAIVIREPRQGKGNVVRRMFADIEADIYLMADGDGTYAPEDAPQLINTLLTERSDMVVGTRRGVAEDAGRAGHAFGNRIFNSLYKRLFGSRFHRHLFRLPRIHAAFRQKLSGCFRGLRDRDGNVGARLAAQAAGQRDRTGLWPPTRRFGVQTVDLQGTAPRSSGCSPCLMKETQPLRFFGAFSAVFMATGLVLMTPVLIEFFETGLVPRLPTWVLSVALVLLSMLMAVAGLIFDRSHADAPSRSASSISA